jgi:hypothetical protein
MKPLRDRDLWHARYLLISDEDSSSTTSYFLARPESLPPYILVMTTYADPNRPTEYGRCSIIETEGWLVKGQQIRPLAEGLIWDQDRADARLREGRQFEKPSN